MADLWFSPGTLLSFTNKTDCHNITEILLKVVLNTINHKTYTCTDIKNIQPSQCLFSRMNRSFILLNIFKLVNDLNIKYTFNNFCLYVQNDKLWFFSRSQYQMVHCFVNCMRIRELLNPKWVGYCTTSILICYFIFILLVHLDQRSRWTIAITWRPSSVNFSHFKLLRNHGANWNQT